MKPMDSKNLAVAYDIKRRNKKMAQGGVVSAKEQSRPMPETKINDYKNIQDNNSKKSSINDDWSSDVTVKQAQKPSRVAMSEPRMVESSVIRTKMRDDERHMMDRMPPKSYDDQPFKVYDEKNPMRKGPDSKDLHMKMMAKGGMINDVVSMDEAEEDQEPMVPMAKKDDMRPSKEEYMADHFAQGGQVKKAMVQPEPEAEEEHHASIAAAIMAKKAKKASESDIIGKSEGLFTFPKTDHAEEYAEGGRVERPVPSHPGDEMLKEGEVDIDDNARELPNAYYKPNQHRVLEHNFDEDIMDMHQPDDSNQINDPREDEESDKHDMVSMIRRKMAMKRQFSKE